MCDQSQVANNHTNDPHYQSERCCGPDDRKISGRKTVDHAGARIAVCVLQQTGRIIPVHRPCCHQRDYANTDHKIERSAQFVSGEVAHSVNRPQAGWP